jgi:ketosteroid isomerase-like protein
MACSQEMTRRETMVKQQTAEALVDSWVWAMSNAQLDSLVLHYDETPAVHVVLPDGRMAKGYEGVNETLREFFGEIQYMNFAISQLEVEVLDRGAAQAVFRHSTDVVDRNNQRAVYPGRGVMVLVQNDRGNQWKIHTQLLSVNRQSDN